LFDRHFRYIRYN